MMQPGRYDAVSPDMPRRISGDDLEILSVYALDETTLRVTFNVQPYTDGLGSYRDGLRPDAYTVTAEASTGNDGEPARAVQPILVDLVDGDPLSLDVHVDRPFSPYPATYTLSMSGAQGPLAGGIASTTYGNATGVLGVHRALQPQLEDQQQGWRDIANPQTPGALADVETRGGDAAYGTYVIDSTGDYAFDEGLISLKKRIYRRLITKKGQFAHAPNYGVGVGDVVKRLASQSVRSQLIAEAQSQIMQEPGVLRVLVALEPKGTSGGLWTMRVLVRTSVGQSARFDYTLTPQGG
jgi:hypothetical protein